MEEVEVSDLTGGENVVMEDLVVEDGQNLGKVYNNLRFDFTICITTNKITSIVYIMHRFFLLFSRRNHIFPSLILPKIWMVLWCSIFVLDGPYSSHILICFVQFLSFCY